MRCLPFMFPYQNSVYISLLPTHHILLYSVRRYKSGSSTLRNYLHYHVTTSYTQMLSGPHRSWTPCIRKSDVWLTVHRNSVWIRKSNWMSLFVFFISLLIVAQHVSGNHVPIISSLRLRDVIASCWYVPWLQGVGQVRLIQQEIWCVADRAS